VHDKLGECGAELLLRTLALLEKGEILPEKQEDALATYAAKIEKEDCLLDFSRTAKEVHDRIRGLSPIPLSFTHTPDGKLLKIVASEPTEGKGRPGEVISLSGGRITVACGEGAVALLSVLPEGKKKMSAADFINGRRISVGDMLS
jgi:methionyl-tRNA formyltransferase